MSRPRDAPARASPKFGLGQMVITAGALAALSHEDVLAALARHAAGDWGELDPEDREANDRALREGGRLVSVYRSSQSVKFYIITEWDRSLTTRPAPGGLLNLDPGERPDALASGLFLAVVRPLGTPSLALGQGRSPNAITPIQRWRARRPTFLCRKIGRRATSF